MAIRLGTEDKKKRIDCDGRCVAGADGDCLHGLVSGWGTAIRAATRRDRIHARTATTSNQVSGVERQTGAACRERDQS